MAQTGLGLDFSTSSSSDEKLAVKVKGVFKGGKRKRKFTRTIKTEAQRNVAAERTRKTRVNLTKAEKDEINVKRRQVMT
jgi:hypothetical protein